MNRPPTIALNWIDEAYHMESIAVGVMALGNASQSASALFMPYGLDCLLDLPPVAILCEFMYAVMLRRSDGKQSTQSSV
jgi:hypothetical protein